MAKISEYGAGSTVIPTASIPVYDPTGSQSGATPYDGRITMTELADVPSVIKGFADAAAITVSAEGATTPNTRDISVQLKDADGNNLAAVTAIELIVFDAADMSGFSSGGSTGIAIDANGLIVTTYTAKVHFRCVTDAAGLLTLTWLDTGTVAAFLGVVLPGGRIVVSDELTNA